VFASESSCYWSPVGILIGHDERRTLPLSLKFPAARRRALARHKQGAARRPEKLAEMDAAIEQAVAEKKLPEACA
jgi:hypothetical protein